MDSDATYIINTGEIYIHEYTNWQDRPELRGYMAKMESLILHLLRINNIPAVTIDTHDEEYFRTKRDQFENAQLRALVEKKPPFTYIFVEVGPDWKLYSYSEPYIVSRTKEDSDIFEFFFAFKLRQIDLMQTDDFLAYHLIASYENNQGNYHRFLDLIIRKHHVLFDEDKRKTVAEWLAMNQTKKTDQNTMIKDTDKIEWLGNQKELAELFIELKRKGWIKKIENKKIKNAFTNSHSIQQVLKPAVDKKTLEPMYEQVYTADYTSKFDQIDENPK